MGKIGRWVYMIALLGAVMVIAAPQPVEAASTTIHISGITVDYFQCSTGTVAINFDLTVHVPDGESAEIWYSADAPGASTPFAKLSGINAIHGGPPLNGPLDFSDPWGFGPFGTGVGPLADNTLITVRHYDIYSSAATVIKVNCTTGAFTVGEADDLEKDDDEKEKDEPYTGINLLTEDVTAPYLGVPNAAGELPCGVFDVNGWGTKYVGMADFPACTAPVELLCLNGDREWTADNVSGVIYHGDYEVDFTSAQDGVCAFFSAE